MDGVKEGLAAPKQDIPYDTSNCIEGSDFNYCYHDTGIRHEREDAAGHVHVNWNRQSCHQYFRSTADGYQLVEEGCTKTHFLLHGDSLSDNSPTVEINRNKGEYTYDAPDL